MDWHAIRTEYVTTDIGYRGLQKKYGVSVGAISKRSKDERWPEQRERFHEETVTKAVHKIATQEANRVARLHKVTDTLMDIIEERINSGDELSTKDLRALIASVKDLKDIQDIRYAKDEEEQDARIAALRSKANMDNNDDDTGVIMMPPRLEA